jgi:hypothetical protein
MPEIGLGRFLGEEGGEQVGLSMASEQIANRAKPSRSYPNVSMAISMFARGGEGGGEARRG